MRCFFLVLFLLSINVFCFGQKPVINSGVYNKWSLVDLASISADGNYSMYRIQNRPAGSVTLVVQSNHSNWKMEFPNSNLNKAVFSSDSKSLVFTLPKDSLGIIRLGEDSAYYIPDVQSFRVPLMGTGKWLAYQSFFAGGELILRNLENGAVRSFDSVIDYSFSPKGNILIFKQRDLSLKLQVLRWLNLSYDSLSEIWNGWNANDFRFDSSENELAFVAQAKQDDSTNQSLWVYKSGQQRAQRANFSLPPGIKGHWTIGDIQEFNPDGKKLFLRLLRMDEGPKPSSTGVQVDVWSYKDNKLQSQQLLETTSPKNYQAVWDTENHILTLLGQQNDRLSDLPSFSKPAMDIALIQKEVRGDFSEINWNPSSRFIYYPVHINTGEVVYKNGKGVEFGLGASLSPDGNYVLYYDTLQRNYISYALSTGGFTNITRHIATTWMQYDNDHPNASYDLNALVGWMEGDSAVLLHDQNDIWVVDPAGKKIPYCLTNQYGKRNHILFQLIIEQRGIPFASGQEIILSAFNRQTKDNGFFSKRIDAQGDPVLLTMGPWIYNEAAGFPGENVVKAKETNAYLVKRMSATEAPNYFFTTDFRRFEPISKFYPEKNFNWVTNELINWKTPDGKICQGILYKPENFDATKRYPLIFYYYEKLSDGLHYYLEPAAFNGPINIPTLVSNGYLVFSPDIHFKIGYPGESALKSIVSAVHYLAKRRYIDTSHMGLQGHSFGGYETNYIVSHTSLFKAAVAAAGLSDFIAGYGGLGQAGNSRQSMYELYQNRMGLPLWQNPDLYMKNSPVIKANKVVTPLLLMHNKKDGAVDFLQDLEFFTALRRLQKKVWLLQYDGEAHTIRNERVKNDYTIRVMQFFDYYLKGLDAPIWMTQGIPASSKGIEDGLAPDRSGEKPE